MKTRFLYIAMILSVIILVWLGRIYMKQNALQTQYTQDVEHTYRVIISLRNLTQLMVDTETEQRGYLLTREERFKRSYEDARGRIDSAMEQLKRIILDNPKQRVNIKLLEPAIRLRTDLLQENLAMRESDKDFGERLDKGKLVMDKIRVYIAAMEQEEYNLLAYREQEKNRYRQLSQDFLRYAFFFACVIFLCSVALIIYELKKRIHTQKMLEKSVFEVARSNEEMDQLSFAASHDLQEPLRKIRTLSTLLMKRYSEEMDSEEKNIVERINNSTERMHGLLENLIDFTNLVNQSEQPAPVDLDATMMAAFGKYIPQQQADIEHDDPLPVIEGFEEQIRLLFGQLFSNAWRYRDPGRKLNIRVSYKISGSLWKRKLWIDPSAKRYHMITISDNGIGFDKSFNEKVFVLFQRLHSKEAYSGQGVGLTIARRIMTNHYGFIEADGHTGEGATFTLFFPAA